MASRSRPPLKKGRGGIKTAESVKFPPSFPVLGQNLQNDIVRGGKVPGRFGRAVKRNQGPGLSGKPGDGLVVRGDHNLVKNAGASGGLDGIIQNRFPAEFFFILSGNPLLPPRAVMIASCFLMGITTLKIY